MVVSSGCGCEAATTWWPLIRLLCCCCFRRRRRRVKGGSQFQHHPAAWKPASGLLNVVVQALGQGARRARGAPVEWRAARRLALSRRRLHHQVLLLASLRLRHYLARRTTPVLMLRRAADEIMARQLPRAACCVSIIDMPSRFSYQFPKPPPVIPSYVVFPLSSISFSDRRRRSW